MGTFAYRSIVLRSIYVDCIVVAFLLPLWYTADSNMLGSWYCMSRGGGKRSSLFCLPPDVTVWLTSYLWAWDINWGTRVKVGCWIGNLYLTEQLIIKLWCTRMYDCLQQKDLLAGVCTRDIWQYVANLSFSKWRGLQRTETTIYTTVLAFDIHRWECRRVLLRTLHASRICVCCAQNRWL